MTRSTTSNKSQKMATAAAAGLLTLASVAQAKLDSSLSRSFWGLAYTSAGTILPECGATQEQVTADILQIAQLTPRIKAYGSDCNQTALILQAIQDTNVDLTIWPTIYVDVPYNQTVVDRQWTAVQEAFKTYGVDHIGGLSVGNEFLLNSYGDGGEPTDSKGVAARTELLDAIKSINTTLVGMDLGKHIPVGTADAGSAITEQLCAGVDYFMGNDHPWFGNVPVDQAAGWTWEFFENNDVAVCKDYPTQMIIGETGWPSDGEANQTSGGDKADVANLQKFLDTYVCEANKNGSEYFYFQFHNNDWAGKTYGILEGSWGLFYSNNTMKDLTLPNCLVDSPTGGTVNQSVLANMSETDVHAAAKAINSGDASSSSGSKSTSKDDKSSALRSGVSVAAAMLGAGVLLALF